MSTTRRGKAQTKEIAQFTLFMATAAVLPLPRAPVEEASAAASAAEDYDDDDDDYDVSRCPICYERAACEPLPHATSSGDASGQQDVQQLSRPVGAERTLQRVPWCRAAPMAPPPKGFRHPPRGRRRRRCRPRRRRQCDDDGK